MYITQEGVNVTERISDGRTKVADDEIQAYKLSRKMNSYHYPLYKEDINGKRQQVGFAVPK